jgi:hypothetical protein
MPLQLRERSFRSFRKDGPPWKTPQRYSVKCQLLEGAIMRTISKPERNGVVVYDLLLRRPDGSIAESLVIPVEITVNDRGVKAEINADSEWTASLNGLLGDDKYGQQKNLEDLSKSLVVVAMKDAMQPYLPPNATVSETDE